MLKPLSASQKSALAPRIAPSIYTKRAAASPIVERHLGPRLLRHDEWIRSHANLAAEWPVERNYQNYNQRKRGGEDASHRHVHAEVLVAE